MQHKRKNCLFLGNKGILLYGTLCYKCAKCCNVVTFKHTSELFCLRLSPLRQNKYYTTRSDYTDVKINNFQRSETTTQISWLLLHNEHTTSIFMMKSYSDNHGQKSWDTLVFSYTEVRKGNKTPNCPPLPSHPPKQC